MVSFTRGSSGPHFEADLCDGRGDRALSTNGQDASLHRLADETAAPQRPHRTHPAYRGGRPVAEVGRQAHCGLRLDHRHLQGHRPNENPTPSLIDIRGATADLALLSAHTTRVLVAEAREKDMNPGHLDGLRDSLNEAALGWRDVHQAWPNKVFGPSAATREQHDASTALRHALDGYTRPDGAWLEGPELVARIGRALPAVSAALREGTRSSYDIATVYQLMPPAHVDAGRLFAPARALSGSVNPTERASLSDDERTRLDARKKGGWVPLATSDLLSVIEALDEQTKRTWTARATVRRSMHPPTSAAPVRSPAQIGSAGLAHERKHVQPPTASGHGPHR